MKSNQSVTISSYVGSKYFIEVLDKTLKGALCPKTALNIKGLHHPIPVLFCLKKGSDIHRATKYNQPHPGPINIPKST